MAEQTAELRVSDFGPVRLIGRKTTVQQGKSALKFVADFRKSEYNDFLQELSERVSPKGDIIIWMGEYDASVKSFTEIPGIFAEPGCEVSEDYDVREIPNCLMAECIIRGKTRSLSSGAHNKLVKLMQKEGYVPDYRPGFSMEYYSYEKYAKDNDEYEFVYMLPCKRL